jgi:hypothetical protein
MALTVDEMLALASGMRDLGVEEFKAGSFAVRFGAEAQNTKKFFSPPANERDILSFMDQDSSVDGTEYTDEDLLASSQ